IPLVAGLAVFVFLALALVAFRAKAGSSGGPDNPWIVSDTPPPPDAPPQAQAPDQAAPPPMNAPVRAAPAALEEALRLLGTGAGLSPAMQEEMRAMMAKGGGHANVSFSVSTSFSRGHGASITTTTSGAPAHSCKLDEAALARARQMSKEGASLDAVCREVLKE